MTTKDHPQKLRDFIKSIRECKTAAEERSVVQKEKALIRESFKNNEEEYRPRNVAKLLFINMLGHNTDFGQMECLKLISASSFTEKRIGYLGLTQLFHEQSDVLLMATSRLLQDLNSSNNYVISLAIIAVSEICTTDMCRELIGNILKIMQNGNSFVRKKVPLAAAKVIKKLPDHIPDIVEKINNLMEDRHHGVLLATLGLIEEIINHDIQYKDKFKKYVPIFVKVLKGLLTNHDSDFDISGVIDPFLQMKILKFFRIMGKGDTQVSEEISDILANVAGSITNNKNTGNAVLYECVQTIMETESSSHLKTLGINILGKFLSQKDYNSKYCALYLLKQVVNFDINAVQKHKQTILDCMKESDISVKQLALDLIYVITNEVNVTSIIKELFNYLLAATDENFLREMTYKICAIVDKHSPNRRWHIDTIIKILTLAGNYIKEESTNNMIHLISISPELQSYAVHKLYFSLGENINQNGLAKAAVYCLGEFGHLLIRGTPVANEDKKIILTEDEVLDLFQKLFERMKLPDYIKEYGLNALIKLYTKFPSSQGRIVDLIESFSTSTSLEVQKRSCEYLKLIECIWDENRKLILEPIPGFQQAIDQYQKKPIGDIDQEEFPASVVQGNTQLITIDKQGGQSQLNAANNNNPLDLMDLMDSTTQPQQQQQQQQKQQQQQQQQQQQNSINPLDLLDLYGGDTTNNGNALQQSQGFGQNNFFQQPAVPAQVTQQPTVNNQAVHQFTAYSDNNLELLFKCTKNGNVITIQSFFNNKTGENLTDIVFLVAVLKHLNLNMQAINNTIVPPYSQGQTTQSMTIENTVQGQKGIALKIKIGYNIKGINNTNQTQVSNFPAGW